MTKFASAIATTIGAVFLIAMLMIGLNSGLISRSKGKTEIDHAALQKALGGGYDALDGLVNKSIPRKPGV
jgi:hypothetical protein